MTLSRKGHARLLALLECSRQQVKVSVSLPLRIDSRANTRGNWRNHAGKHAAQRNSARMSLARHRDELREVIGFRSAMALVVRLVRIAPRGLDDDNLSAAFKSLRDGIAEALGVDDRDERVMYVVDEERGRPKQYGVRFEFYVSARLDRYLAVGGL